jgi:uncharacterized protein (UPF0335 family)
MSETIGKGTSAAEKLRNYIERIEVIRADKENLSDEEKAVFADAKAAGFIPKAMRYVLKVRAMAPGDWASDKQLAETYLQAMELEAQPDLFFAAGLAGEDLPSRERVLDVLRSLAPIGGSIELEVGGLRTRLTRTMAGEVVEELVTEPKPAEPVTLPRSRAKAADAPVPDCDREGAEQLGCEAYKANQSITRNPFPRDDDRRERWDRGWRAEMFGKSEGEDR